MTAMDEAKWFKRIEREKKARHEAERLLEEKSLALFHANEKLRQLVTLQAGDIALRDTLFHKLSNTFVNLGVNYEENINKLTAACGELLDATCCLYNRLNQHMLHSIGVWNAPPDLVTIDEAEGHVCFDVIRHAKDMVHIRNLDQTSYYQTDKVVAAYDLKTYIGHPVFCAGKAVGSLCLVYKMDRHAGDLERQVLSMLATAIGVEEDRWNSQLQIENALKEAQRANQAKTLFLATMSHEIRTPLTGILGYADLLLSEHQTDNTQEGLVVIKQSGRLLLGLINDILDYAKIENGTVEFSHDIVDISQLLRDTISMHRLAAEKKNLLLECSIEPSDIVLTTDADRLRQIVSNLLGNAIKFTEKGSVKVHATLANDALLHISVQDTGCGFSPENIDKIFSPFFQENTHSTRNYGGTGLGLAICHKLISSMNGKISAKLRVNGGAEFQITLPISSLDTSPDVAQITNASTSKFSSRQSILIAEDHVENAILLKKMLEKSSFDVDIALNGNEAIMMLHEKKYRAIFMDMRMPVMDGLEATRRIREGACGADQKDIFIIAVTANAFPSDKEACRRAGMNTFLGKPINVTELQKILGEL